MEVFHRIQVLRDETMAATAAGYLQNTADSGRRLLVFTGGNHVRYGFGVPRRLYRRLPVPYVVVDTFITDYPDTLEDHQLMDVALPSLPLRPADFYWAVTYEDLAVGPVTLGVQVAEGDHGGVRVQSVVPGGAAERAGVMADDLILSLGGEPVADGFDLRYLVSLRRPGETAPLTVQRGAERLQLAVTYRAAHHGAAP
jgi:hypothetical protein